jgi:putative transposase
MATTFTSILLHCIFSTKNRVPLILPEIEDQLHAYMGGIVANHRCRLLCMGGTANHVHMLVSMSKNLTVVELLEEVKKDSSKWIKTQGPAFADFYWQEGYAAFSIGASGVAGLRRYCAAQKRHHQHTTFEEELVLFLEKYGIPYDERYIWR